jgi:hypothetical protein
MGGLKGGPARAAKLTPAQRSDSARNAVRARWAKVQRAPSKGPAMPSAAADTSDRALRSLLKQIKAAKDPGRIRQLSDRLERVIFHKQFENA